MYLVLVILAVVFLFGGIGSYPAWGHSSQWGYGPSGGLGLLFIIVLVLLLSGRL